MKHLAIMVVLTLLGTVGALANGPVWGLFIYYFFAVLRPQFIWQWDLQIDLPWSAFVAYTTLACFVGEKLGMFQSVGEKGGPVASRLTRAHQIVLVFGFWISITYFTAISQDRAWPYFVEYIKIFLMFYVGAHVLKTTTHLWALFLMAAGTLAYIAFEVNDIYFRQGGYMFIYRRGYGGLDNNGAGLMLAMGVPLCFFAWEGTRAKVRWLFLLLIPVIIHAVLMSFSRGAMLSVIAGAPFYLLRSRYKVRLGLMMAIVLVMIPFLAGNEIRSRFFSISEHDADASANARKTTWSIAWRMAQERPLFGFGIRNSNLFTLQYGADMEGRTIHSQYLQTAADSGLTALALYLMALFACWRSAVRVMKSTKHRVDVEGCRAHAIAGGVEGAMVVFCFGALFLSLENFELPYLMLLLAAQLPVVLQPEPAPLESAEKAWEKHAFARPESVGQPA